MTDYQPFIYNDIDGNSLTFHGGAEDDDGQPTVAVEADQIGRGTAWVHVRHTDAARVADELRAAAGLSPAPADRAELRDSIAEGLLDHLSRTADIRRGDDGESAFMPVVTDAERMRLADAALALLPASVDRVAELETANTRMRHELEVMYGGAFDSLKSAPADRAAGVAEAIRTFPFDNFGMDDVSFALEDDPEAQEWVPALAAAVLATLPATTAQAVEVRDYWHQEAMSATTRIIELEGQVEEMRRAAAATVDRAAVLRELADQQEATAATDVIRNRRSIATARRLFAVELRRMADEVQPS